MKQKLFIASLILACLSLMAYTAQANLILMLPPSRQLEVSTVVDAEHVNVTAGTTGTITYDVYASFTNTVGAGLQLHVIIALIQQPAGSVKGNMARLRMSAVGYDWSYTGSQVGTAQDINADTYLDVGGLTTGTANTQKINEIMSDVHMPCPAALKISRYLQAGETSIP